MADRICSERVQRRRVSGRLAPLVVTVSTAATVGGVDAYANDRLHPRPAARTCKRLGLPELPY